MPTPRKKRAKIDRLPLLPLKDMVVFPRMVVPLLVGRPASLAAVEESLASERPLFLTAQHDVEIEHPGFEDLYGVGVAATVLQTLRMPDGTMKVVVEGLVRGNLRDVVSLDRYAEAEVTRIEEPPAQPEAELEALMRTAIEQFEVFVRHSQRIAPEIVASLRTVEEPDAMADLMCAYLPLRVAERQSLLETLGISKRIEKMVALLLRENEMLEIERKVRDRVREQMDQGQREYYLNEQLKAIRQELGHDEEGADEYAELREQIEKANLPEAVRAKAERELSRYERMPAMSPESAVIRNYLEWILDLPWDKRSRDKLDLKLAEKVLNKDHYGLAKVKERILEFLAVRKLSKNTRGPILCLVGPPGVGKTSLGQSVARAMGRKFVRVSLGGVRDEAEIRGHRRTYIGSLPGRIVQSLAKAGVKNPVFMLDEIDKMSMDFRGDPSSALLEVLDPEQNRVFSDHYIEVDVDLHEVFFIATANTEHEIPPALHDRMELVRLSGYTSYEKEKIAQMFLIPKQMRECGLTKRNITFTKSGLTKLIQRYTREAGVRELERQIAHIGRKVARTIAADGTARKKVVDDDAVRELLGPEPYSDLRAQLEAEPGLAVGLAWTSTGGDILDIETTTMSGKGKLTLTGQLGDVMKESAQAALTCLRARAKTLGIQADFYKNLDIHVHVPEGAIPKDGPSAGIVIAVSMLSALRREAPRSLTAMTGEITLRGRVLPVGGVKEKVLAAHRAGIKDIIMPKENEKDLEDVPKDILAEITFHFAENMDEVFASAFATAPKP
jgi:ATP-dependent Lon protease